MGADRVGTDPGLTQAHFGAGGVVLGPGWFWKASMTWMRVVGAGAGGLQVFDQQFEGHVLVFERGQAVLADVGQQVGGSVWVGVGA
ncbi:hypothetical protein MMRN_29550 [Mycobacterium marinum]|nr:hypothetical protein MMRN_29550 [Mycobacterium marinum]